MKKKIKLIIEYNPYVKKVVKFCYQHTYRRYKNYIDNKIFIKNALLVLEQADKVFKEIGKDYWLECGTLLGAVRNKDFIKYDSDLDFGMFLNDYSSNHVKIFNKYGFEKTKEFTIDNGKYGREETYVYLGVSLDIFFFTRASKSKAYYHGFGALEGKSGCKTIMELGGLVPIEYLLTLEKIGEIEFKGKIYPVPEPCDVHLSEIYGDDYMIENPTWYDGLNDNPTLSVLTDKVGVFKENF